MARLRKAPVTQGTTTRKAATSTRQALREKTNIAKGPVYPDDGNTEALVKDAPKKRGGQTKAQRQENGEEEYLMAGALGPSSEATAKPASDALTTTDELAKSSDSPRPGVRGNRRPARTVRKIVQNEAQSKVLDALKQRMAATANGQRARQSAAPAASVAPCVAAAKQLHSTTGDKNAERSEFSLSPSPPRPGKLSAVKRASMALPGSVMKVQMTPAVESSMLALKNFKRRPRQPSMLQMVQQRLGSARPSLANSAVNVDDDAVDDSSVFDLGLDYDEEEEDFAPDAEGTPLHVKKAKRRSTVGSSKQGSLAKLRSHERNSSTTRKRRSDHLDVSSGSLSGPRAKRRKPGANIALRDELDEGDNIIVRSSQRPDEPPSNVNLEAEEEEIVIRSSSGRTETPRPTVTSEIEVNNSPSSSTPPTEPPASGQEETAKDVDEFVVPSTEPDREAEGEDVNAAMQQNLADEGDDAESDSVMAEPLSSPAPEASRPDDDILAEPATQVPPSPAPVKANLPSKKSKPMHTAALQSLLPKRRAAVRPRHRKSEYDLDNSDEDDAGLIDVSHLEEDEDELGGRRGRRAASRSAGAAKSKKAAQTKKAQTKKASKPSARGSTTTKGMRTYGRTNTSNKENEGHQDEDFVEAEDSTLPEISLSMQEASRSAELEAAKRKFAEVDQWEFEFESMSGEAHRSSSPAWR